MTINDQNHESTLQGTKAAVLFWAPWCHFCKPMKESLQKIDAPMPTYSCDIESEGAAYAHELKIASLPTMVMFDDGKEVKRQPGVLDLEQLQNWLAV